MHAILFAACLLGTPATAVSQETAQEQTDLARLLKMVEQQGEELKKQRELLDAQAATISEMQRQLDSAGRTASRDTAQPAATETPAAMPPQISQEQNAATSVPAGNAAQPAPQTAQTAVTATEGEQNTATATTGGSSQATAEFAAASPEADTSEQTDYSEATETASQRADTISFMMYDRTQFKGAFLIPNTDIAMRIGGTVKANLIESFNSVGSQTRFIVGTIPTSNETEESQRQSQAALTVQQSRLNFEVRQNEGLDQVRAFIEGDFSGNNDTFKLRHAFGQYRAFLAGKTWTAFMDREASPEEVDFEGLNSRINVRQTQLRYFPSIARDWNFAISLEDPQPNITGGAGVSKIPDLVLSVRGFVRDRWNVHTALLLRQLSATWEPADVNTPGYGSTADANGWGLSLSGRRFIEWFGDDRDNLMVQFNYGKGYGRYVNDLGTIGGQDAVFDNDGNLRALTVFATYIAAQKWWDQSLRSTFTIGLIDIDNYDFQAVSDYNKTWRTGGNLIWSPTGNLDIGGELLWGERTDKNGATGSASQVQAMARFSF